MVLMALIPLPCPNSNKMNIGKIIPNREDKAMHNDTRKSNEPLAWCAHCRKWTPMKWLPKNERGKQAESWFQCAVCSGRDLTLRYLSEREAVAKNRAASKIQ